MMRKIKGAGSSVLLILAFFIVVAGLLVAGHYYHLYLKNTSRAEQFRLLAAIVASETDEVANWLGERRAEVRFLSSNDVFIQQVELLREKGAQPELGRRVEQWLEPIRKNHHYQCLAVLNMRGEVEVASGDISVINPSIVHIAATNRSKLTGWPDFAGNIAHNQKAGVLLTGMVPLFADSKMVGSLVFVVDPAKELFPGLSEWPVPISSGESMLVALAGDTITFLTPRPQMTSRKMHRGELDDPVVAAIPPQGTLAEVTGLDYRGEQVLASVRRVPGTNWSVISKIDQSVVFEPLKQQALNMLIYLVAFVSLLVVASILVWKNQQLRYYRSRYNLQIETAKAEERIRFMTALLEEVNDAIITFDKDLMIKSWNKGAEHIYGWTAEEVVGKYGGGSLRVDFPGAKKEVVFKELERTGSWRGEVVHKRKDGTTAYILCSTSQLKDSQGNILGIMAINKDISDVIHSEKTKNAVYRISELAHSTRDNNDLYTSIHIVIGELMDARNLFIALVDKQKGFVTFPYFVDEKRQLAPEPASPDGLIEYVLRTGKPLLAKPEDVNYMIERGIITLEGKLPVDWLGVPLAIDNEIIGVLAVQSYSPSVRYSEREKAILLYVSRQIALTIHRRKMQDELLEAKERAEVSSKLTSSLLANMNHELRTPMNGILGFAELLMDELENGDQRAKASNILSSGRRLMDTLDAIMDLSYLESDKVSRRFSPVPVEKIVRKVLLQYESLIRQKGLTVKVLVPHGLMILGNEHLVQHLVKNLVDNALKYTPEGGLTISAKRVELGGRFMISVTVADTGIGIHPDDHRMIFDAFRQVSEGYGRRFEGSGLGLTISKKIVTLMGGEISVRSTIGHGSEFTFLLPSAMAEGKVSEEPLPTPVKATATPPPGFSPEKLPHLLLVEDNLVNLHLLIFYLKDICNVYSALDGKMAVEMTLQRQFDGIFMDINLGPGMDGIQAMLEIRKRPDYKQVPIIAVTGYASIGDRDRLISIGFDDYLGKPFERDEVMELMKSLFPGTGTA